VKRMIKCEARLDRFCEECCICKVSAEAGVGKGQDNFGEKDEDCGSLEGLKHFPGCSEMRDREQIYQHGDEEEEYMVCKGDSDPGNRQERAYSNVVDRGSCHNTSRETRECEELDAFRNKLGFERSKSELEFELLPQRGSGITSNVNVLCEENSSKQNGKSPVNNAERRSNDTSLTKMVEAEKGEEENLDPEGERRGRDVREINLGEDSESGGAYKENSGHTRELDGEVVSGSVLSVLKSLPTLEVLKLCTNPVSRADNPRRVTRRQLIVHLACLTCLDGRAIHPREREYIEGQVKDAYLKESSGASKTAGNCNSGPVDKDLVFLVLDQVGSHRLLVTCAMVCRAWRDDLKVRIGSARLTEARSQYQSAVSALALLHPLQLRDPSEVQDYNASLRAQPGRWVEWREWNNPVGPVIQMLSALTVLWKTFQGEEKVRSLESVEEMLESLSLPDLGSSTWRSDAVTEAQPMLESEDFPSFLFSFATLMDFETMIRLRAMTGSADDLDEYVPVLDLWAVSRYSSSAGRLCAWLLAVEAKAWTWSNVLSARDAANLAGVYIPDEQDEYRFMCN